LTLTGNSFFFPIVVGRASSRWMSSLKNALAVREIHELLLTCHMHGWNWHAFKHRHGIFL